MTRHGPVAGACLRSRLRYPFRYPQVFPSGSTIRQGLDSAVISMIVNSTWVNTREALEAYWFGSSPLSPSVTPSTVNMPTLVAALVMVGVWIVGAVGRSLYTAVQERKKRTAKPAEEAPAVPILRPAAAAAAAAREAARAADAAARAAEAAAVEEAKARAAVLNSGKMPFLQLDDS